MLQTPRFSLRLGALALLAAALPAAPAGAEIFRVHLHNGTTMETSYQPQQASWDAGMVLLQTEVGNWVGVRRDEIESVTSEAPLRGYGVRINTTTVLLGDAPNDAVVAGEPGAGGNTASGNAPGNGPGPQGQQPAGNTPGNSSYTIQQFVEPNQTQGIPASLISPIASPTPK